MTLLNSGKMSTYNEAQIQAITTIQGPVMVISCAGSGKTTVILERTARILQLTGRPARILVVTFSKAAATEMEERFREKYGAGGVRFSTIHSICYSVLASTYGLKADAILKESERRQFFRSVQESLMTRGTGNHFCYRPCGIKSGKQQYFKQYL